jgi:hypothetical protein
MPPLRLKDTDSNSCQNYAALEMTIEASALLQSFSFKRFEHLYFAEGQNFGIRSPVR